MARTGAAGATGDEIDAVLHAELAGDVAVALGSLDAELAQRPGTFPAPDGEDRAVELSFANALWPQRGFPFLDAFLEGLGTRFGAGLHVVDYVEDHEGARRAINGWVDDETAGRIPELVPDGVLTTTTRLVLTNALYLNAPWAHPFDPGATSPVPFHRLDGTTTPVPTMHLGADLAYAAGDGWQAVELPYLGDELAMVVVVPDAGGFDAVEADLDPVLVDAVAAALEPRAVDLALPAWEQRTQASLEDPLVALGMPTAFSDGADFSAMSPEPLAITDVVHEVFVAVDEAGTEAAAATAVVVGETAAPAEPVELVIDRPFLYWIVDRTTGALLFLGRVVEPDAG
jgi:serpin B